MDEALRKSGEYPNIAMPPGKHVHAATGEPVEIPEWASVDSGTCHSTTDDSAWCFACSECGKSFPRNDLHLAHNHGDINYCPNCGWRVKGGAE